ncbi:ribonuclease III [Candidatus Saccharibacteria bacterium]|nr:ribonuclease III [Candidatus Saccharibacteria bacterium]
MNTIYLTRDQIDEYQNFAKEQLGFEFNNIDLLVTALTHRSYVNEHKRSAQIHNERLEFLGDAVLELVVSDYLYRNYNRPEGTMTAWRSALVRTESIGEAGEKLGYSPLIRLSKGERNGTDRALASIIADCFEAIIGAIYLDQDYQTAKDFIYKHIISKAKEIIHGDDWRDPKTYLQEFAQKIDGVTPQYQLTGESGPDHDKTFSIALRVGKYTRGRGTGKSKQDAQEIAARQGIEYYKSILTPEELETFREQYDNRR